MPTTDEIFQKRWDALWKSSKLNLIAWIIKESRINKSLQEENGHLRVKISELENQISNLQEQIAKLQRNSSTSSKPPSSDIVKPPKAKSSGSGKSGGQKGHPGFWHGLFKTEQIDEIKEYRLSECPSCKIPLGLEHQTRPWIHQVAELPEKLTRITEHRRLGYLCPQCQKQRYAPLPEGIREGDIFGPPAPKLGCLHERRPSRLLHFPRGIHAGSL